MSFVESKCVYESGTEEPRPNAEYCSHCKRYVTETECGATVEAAELFASVTAALPCRFERLATGKVKP